ncbi:MAG: class I SAM-dependent methyltransferase [Rubrivivax sp.]
MATYSPAVALWRWPWPLPALGAWAVAWASFWLAMAAGLPSALALPLALWLPLWMAWRSHSLLRRALLLTGFPLALVLQGQVVMPPWLWLAPLSLLLLMYPVRAWRDAPLFPTAHDALKGLSRLLVLEAGDESGAPAILDAGCGLGHALRALRHEWPDARLQGVERSVVLAALAACWRRDAQIRVGDMWRESWSDLDVVYLFQRPESMPRAWHKACAEMRPGSWLVSLEFEVPGHAPEVRLDNPDGRPVMAWRIPPRPRATQWPPAQADKSDMRRPQAAC